jgi:hypothetical protein
MRTLTRPGRIWAAALCLLMILGAAGCESRLEQENRALHEQVNEVHDEAMAKSGELYDLRIRLRGRLEHSPPEQQRTITEVLVELENADEAMFDWMRTYQPLAVDDSIVVDTDYRRAELAKIAAIGDDTEAVIARAESLLAQISGKTPRTNHHTPEDN